jgi:hypothetical protein
MELVQAGAGECYAFGVLTEAGCAMGGNVRDNRVDGLQRLNA